MERPKMVHTCSVCGKRLSRATTLRAHLFNVHGPGKMKQKLSMLDQTSALKRKNVEQLTAKLWSRVKVEKPKSNLSCKHCTKEFDKRSVLVEHISRSHRQGVVNSSTKCIYCDKNFAKPWILRRHIKNVHKQVGLYKRINAPRPNRPVTEIRKKKINYIAPDGLESDPTLCPNANQLLEWGFPEGSLPEIAEYWDMIRSKHRTGKLLRQYNKRLSFGQFDAGEIRDFVMLVHKQQTSQYKLQVCTKQCVLYA